MVEEYSERAYEIHATEIVVFVIAVGHRKATYRRLLARK